MKRGPKVDDVERKIRDTIQWLEDHRADTERKMWTVRQELYFGWSRDPAFDRYRFQEFQSSIEQLEQSIALNKERLKKYRYEKRIERQRKHEVEAEKEAEPLIYAVDRPDPLTVKSVDSIPKYADHTLATQIDRRAAALEAWHYRCLGMGNRRPKRRYEGFHANG